MFELHTAYGHYNNCTWNIEGSGKHTCYEIINDEGSIMTVNVPGYGKSDTIVAIKNYSENEGIMDFLKIHGLIKKIHGYVPSGFVKMPLVELDIEKLKSMNEE